MADFVIKQTSYLFSAFQDGQDSNETGPVAVDGRGLGQQRHPGLLGQPGQRYGGSADATAAVPARLEPERVDRIIGLAAS